MRPISFITILIADFIDNLLFNILIPVLPFYSQKLGLQHTELGWLISSYTCALLLTVFVSGLITDKIGSSRTFMFGSALLLPALLLFAITESYSLMIFARVLQGISAGFTWVSGFSYVAKYSRPENRARNLVFLQSCMGLAEFTGPVFGGVLYENGGVILLFTSLLLVATLNLCLRLFVRDDTSSTEVVSARLNLGPLADSRIFKLSLLYMIGGFLLSLSDPILPVFLKNQYKIGEGWVSAAFLVMTTAYYVLALPLAAYYKSTRPIYIGVVLSCFTLVLIFLPQQNLVILFISLAAFGFSTGLFIPPIVSRIAEAVAEKHEDAYGVAFSSGQWSFTFGMFMGPLASTQLADRFSYFEIVCILALVPLALVAFIRRI